MKLQWTKIGEVTKTAGLFQPGLYAQYAVMESICENGMRKYKEVFMYTWRERRNVKEFNPQSQAND